jgi:hypothetical protein
MTLKGAAVKKHGDDLKGKIADFITNEVEGNADDAGDELAASRKSKGVYILDSAGEDLPTQDYEGQLQTAKSLGFKTYIVWLNTGPEVSYVGNLERSVAGGKRAVPAGEIAAYYDAAEGGMAGGKSAKDYFTSLTQQNYTPTDDDDPHAVSLGDVPLLDKVLVLNQKNELTDQVIASIEGTEVDIPTAVKAAMGAGFKDMIKNVQSAYDKEDLKDMSDEDLQVIIADLGVDIEELATSVIKKVKDTRQNAIRGLIKKGKGSGFETEEISAESVSRSDDMIMERWQKLAGLL